MLFYLPSSNNLLLSLTPVFLPVIPRRFLRVADDLDNRLCHVLVKRLKMPRSLLLYLSSAGWLLRAMTGLLVSCEKQAGVANRGPYRLHFCFFYLPGEAALPASSGPPRVDNRSLTSLPSQTWNFRFQAFGGDPYLRIYRIKYS